jgi:hypothetical protein
MMNAPRRTPPDGQSTWRVPFRAVRATPLPALSAATAQRLERHVEWALSQRDGWQDHLRPTVRVVVAELTLVGFSRVEIGRVLADAVVDHPQRPRFDAVSLVSREPRSVTLVALMHRWVAGERAPRR